MFYSVNITDIFIEWNNLVKCVEKPSWIYHFSNLKVTFSTILAWISVLRHFSMDMQIRRLSLKLEYIFEFSEVYKKFAQSNTKTSRPNIEYCEKENLTSSWALGEGLLRWPATLAGSQALSSCRTRLPIFLVLTRYGDIQTIETFVLIMFLVSIW